MAKGFSITAEEDASALMSTTISLVDYFRHAESVYKSSGVNVDTATLGELAARGAKVMDAFLKSLTNLTVRNWLQPKDEPKNAAKESYYNQTGRYTSRALGNV